jgi:EAL domain-containing protein (putative c-di-GMP-specific phosphodiesterase class I)
MKEARGKGTNHFSFTQQQITFTDHDDTMELMKDFPAAIENGEIYFLYQLQYSSKSGHFTGAEILARWEHPNLGDISPSLFIPLAEQSGMISALTIKALVHASKVFQKLKDENIENFSLSINISPTFLTSSTFLSAIKFVLDEYHEEQNSLNFEITEESLIKNMEYLSVILVELKSYNIGIELDDFGTGYTSLKYLASLPIDTLKIDKSFITGIDKDCKKQALLKAIVDISKSFDFDLIAEGVENRDEDAIIQAYDSIKVQGYYHAKPMELSSMIEYLKNTQSH